LEQSSGCFGIAGFPEDLKGAGGNVIFAYCSKVLSVEGWLFSEALKQGRYGSEEGADAYVPALRAFSHC
jgi:hypothetical protein